MIKKKIKIFDQFSQVIFTRIKESNFIDMNQKNNKMRENEKVFLLL